MFKRGSPQAGGSGISKILSFSPFSKKDAKERVARVFESMQDPFGAMATRATLFPGEGSSDSNDIENSQENTYMTDDSVDKVPEAPSVEPVLSPAEVLANMEQGFFTEGFDGLGFVMENMPPEGFNEETLRQQEEAMLFQLEVVSGAVNARVMENYSEFVGGMALVSQLQQELQMSLVVVRNGRRFLSRADDDVQSSLAIASLNRKKARLIEVLEVFKLLQMANSIEVSIRNKISENNFVEAICEYVEGCTMLTQVEELKCEPALRARLTESFKAVVEHVDVSLMRLCDHFDPVHYQKVFEAYHLLLDICSGDELKPIDVKLQEGFMAAVERESDGVLVGYTLSMDSSEDMASQACNNNNNGGGRVQYKELCRHLPAQNFHSCLCTTLQVLFDILCNHHKLMLYHKNRSAQSAPPSVSQSTKNPAEDTGDEMASSAPSDEGLASGDPTVTVDSPKKGDEVSERERAVCKAVASTLRNGARTIWEIAGMRVGALLNAPSAPDGSHFMQILQLAQKFIQIGEDFTRTEAVSLRGHVAKTSATFFAAKQHRHLEVLRMMLDKEMWHRVPLESVPQISQDLSKSFKSLSRSPLASPSSSSPFSQWSAPSKTQETAESEERMREAAAKRDPFEKWVLGRNPFVPKSEEVDDEEEDEERNDKAEEGEEEKGKDKSTGGGAGGDQAGKSGACTLGASDGEDEEDEELHGDFIDEESQTVGKRSRPGGTLGSGSLRRAGSSSMGGGRGKEDRQGLSNPSAVVTASSVHLLRCLAEYMWLTTCLGSGASMIFAAICQLFECYFLSIFQTFGKKESLQSDSYDLTPRLHQTLLRLSERSMFTSASSPSSIPAPAASSQNSNGSQASGAAGSFNSSGNMYGLKERCVAAQSLHTVAEEALKARPILELHLGPGSFRDIEQFYSRTVDAVEDLREHIYKAAARLLLNLQWLPDEIGDSETFGSSKKYDRREVGMQHNAWVDRLLAQFTQFGAKVMCVDMPQETNCLLWEYASEATSEAILEGLSRVRKCTEMGRACMALDLQVVVQSLKKHMSIFDKEPNVMIVDNYIKAFYIQESQFIHWTMTHPEYTRAQVIALVNQIATAYNWKRSQRSDMLAKLEECFMN